MASMDDIYQRLKARYESGDVPWDQELPPPEVIAFVAEAPPGRALDLGCGYGRASIYLARHGWRVDAVDFVDQAIAVARERAHQAGADERIDFHVASIPALDFLSGPYDLALDVGCGHGLDADALRGYRDQLARLLRPGALFLLYTRVEGTGEPETAGDGPPGLDEMELRRVFADGFELARVEHGTTTVQGGAPWSSAWFWFRRLSRSGRQ